MKISQKWSKFFKRMKRILNDTKYFRIQLHLVFLKYILTVFFIVDLLE